MATEIFERRRGPSPSKRCLRPLQLGRQVRCLCVSLFSACVTNRDGIVTRATLNYCSKLNKSLAETHKLIVQAYGGSALSYSQVSRWLKAFKGGREGVVDEPRAGRPSIGKTDDNLARVGDLLNSDRRLSVWMIAETLNIPKTIIHELVTDKLDMRKVCAKLAPKLGGRSEESPGDCRD
ncbi:hypothetical protein J437_LFUL016981 [Ladona fulva]|uniref:Mos1 transposase HTH domain-containing protein n=1 Tax=Ladona fulva TaxID=123851 RepID=A0A8K0KLK0_LADFU|nr:hypothetical protein J437_LFUL016981 [Ladona fulva]